MSDRQEKSNAVSRRSFMKIAGVGAGAAGAYALAAPVTGEAVAAAGPDKATGYRETEHIRTYYEFSRF